MICSLKILLLVLFASWITHLKAQGASTVSGQTLVITSPPQHVPSGTIVDGALMGNGDLGVVIGGPPEHQRFYIGKNDFWSQQMSPMSIGGIDLVIPALGGASYREEEDLLNAEVRGTFGKGDTKLLTTSWVSATENLFVLGLKNEGSQVLKASAQIFPNGAVIRNNQKSVNIGREEHEPGRNYFNGLIDEVHIYDRALESNDVLRVMRFDDQRPGLVRRWTFDSEEGTTAADTRTEFKKAPECNEPVSVYRPIERPVETPTGCEPDGFHYDYLRFGVGVRGRAVKIMHSFDYIDAGQVPDLAKVTVSAWIYIYSAGDSNFILSKGEWNEAYSLSLDQGRLRFNVGDAFVRSTDALPTHKWVHVAGTFDGFVLRAYIDGEEVSPRARMLTSGSQGDLLWMSRNADGPLDEQYPWPNPLPPSTGQGVKGREISVAMRLIGAPGAINDGAIEFSLQPGAEAYIVTPVLSDLAAPEHLRAAEQRADEIDIKAIAELRNSHRGWWKNFWSKSSVQIDDPLVEKFYYSSLYISASAMRDGKVFPGLYGPWVTTDHPSWNGDYTLDYNNEMPTLGLYSSNHVDITGGYDPPILDFMPRGKMYARTILNVRGVFYPAHIGPWGIERRFDYEPFEGMKEDAAFSAVPMMMRFYSTYDHKYAAEIYPFVKEVGEFWEDYLKKENNIYVIHEDCLGEIGPWREGSDDWAKCDGATENTSNELAFLRVVFKGLLNLSEELKIDDSQRAQWQDILDHLSPYTVDDSSGKPMLLTGSNSSKIISVWGSQAVWPAGQIGIGEDEKLREAALNINEIHGYEQHPLVPTALARLGYDPQKLLDGMHKHCSDRGYPNGYIYYGGGGVETPSIIPATVDEMLLQSFTGELRLFPTWPVKHDASFTNLRAYGAFLVSSSMKSGEIQDIAIYSERGRRCSLKNPWPGKTIVVIRDGVRSEKLTGEHVSFATTTNENIEVHHE
jgi:hypothetical protein